MIPAQRSPADPGEPRHAETARRARGHAEVLWLVLVGAAVTVVVVTGLLLFGAPPVGVSPAPAPAPQAADAALATVLLDDDGNVKNTVFSFTTRSSVLHLSVPRRTGLAADFDVSVRQVSVVLDGRAISVDGPIGIGETRSVTLPDGSNKVDVVYSTRGTFKPTTPAPSAVARRGLTLLTPLLVEEAQSLQTAVQVVDDRVRNVGCVYETVMSVCGTQADASWVVRTDHATDILAQLDLE